MLCTFMRSQQIAIAQTQPWTLPKSKTKRDAAFSTNADCAKEHQHQPTELTDADPPLRTFAASSATEAEEKTATKEGRHLDGSTPLLVPKRVWHPKMQMAHKEPKETLNASGNLDWLCEEHGKVGIKNQGEHHQETIQCSATPKVHSKEINDNIQW
jgi:hypothetical protein